MTGNSDRTNFENIQINEQALSSFILADPWRRLAAVLIDIVIVSVVQLPIAFVIIYIFGGPSATLPSAVKLIGSFITYIYAFYFLTNRGATIGKSLLQIKVVRRDGMPINFKTVFMREVVGKIVAFITLGIGYLLVAFRDDKRGLHDLLADTQVVRKSKS